MMPRPRKNDPSTILTPLIERFVADIAATVEKFTVRRIAREIGRVTQGRAIDGRGRASVRRKRAKILCYAPGCKNIAAPRFGMFCVKEHKNLSKAEKAKYRAQHLAASRKGPAKAARRARRSKSTPTNRAA